jgi:hypothetical protein
MASSSVVPEVQIGTRVPWYDAGKEEEQSLVRLLPLFISLSPYTPFHDDCALHSVLFDELSRHPSQLTTTITVPERRQICTFSYTCEIVYDGTKR